MTQQQGASQLAADPATLAVESERFLASARADAAADAPYGVLDVGSNSIRLVVFEGLNRAPAPIFNERELCGLGATLAETGALAPDAVEPALDALRRFSAAATALGVAPLDAVTTAAVREARDGERFRAAAAREAGFSLRVLSGEEEARYAALGVVSAFPAASGLMADLGGGSLELVRLEQGRLAEHATLPLGVLRLGSLKPGRRTALAAERLETLPWLDRVRGEPVYLVGGAWRALARLHMAAEQYPIAVVHHYRMAAAEARRVAGEYADADPSTLQPGPEGMWPRRLATVPSGAAVLIALLKIARPSDVLFSAFGLREGLLFDRLPPAVRALDPLHDACRAIARRDGRSLAYAEALESWLARAALPAFDAHRSVLPAAAFLSEIAWRQHPDLRATDAFARISRAPSSASTIRAGCSSRLPSPRATSRPAGRSRSRRAPAAAPGGAGRGPRAGAHAQARRAALLRGAGGARRIRARGRGRPPRAEARGSAPAARFGQGPVGSRGARAGARLLALRRGQQLARSSRHGLGPAPPSHSDHT